MALVTTDRGCPDVWLRCRRSGRQEEEESWPREAAVCCSDRRSRDWGPERAQQAPTVAEGNSGSCPMHPKSRHSAAECREIIELAKRVSERHEQTSKDGSPPRR
jgi:hypothetical protein